MRPPHHGLRILLSRGSRCNHEITPRRVRAQRAGTHAVRVPHGQHTGRETLRALGFRLGDGGDAHLRALSCWLQSRRSHHQRVNHARPQQRPHRRQPRAPAGMGCASSTPASDGSPASRYTVAASGEAPSAGHASGIGAAASVQAQQPAAAAESKAVASSAKQALSAAAENGGASGGAQTTTPSAPGPPLQQAPSTTPAQEAARASQDAKRNGSAPGHPAAFPGPPAVAAANQQDVNPSLKSLTLQEANTVQSTLLKVGGSVAGALGRLAQQVPKAPQSAFAARPRTHDLILTR